ncbi:MULTISPECIES: alpha/beta hydrolase [Caulobacter]|jgi:pimeloyl-ACP methyl ester carboxylesterase|uniref:Putative hydrolase or acyltransferase of alpha/beta superfamily n=1 Tax=Caulobacter vibrioides OR37 TaxID=1292034 RepID=R0EQB2_CAUVI|nr:MULTISPECIES: alpha/beta hydrolase [Caulobacter]ENZ83187.1 putative hydrolase or acyltransferase of alpha/beta superfamily [Caulobacter vibrioides OR37]MBQ1561893.1 alpha/beta hydrolase [Caulobacter sp.]
MADDQAALAAPLAPFGGQVPPAPAWFEAAVAQTPERSALAVEGADIELLTWGRVGKPGLLFLHGNGAHADWWSFIAPFFANDWRVAAISWSGMGGSDWRSAYSAELFATEIFAAVEAAGLEAGGVKPMVVGHSFGGFPTLYCAARHPERLRGAIMVDSSIQPPEKRWKGPPPRSGLGNRVYPTLEEALARFRLAPPQPCENLYIADFIARRSLKEVEGGWTWKFDPELWHNFRMPDLGLLLPEIACPAALMWGERSNLMHAETLDYMVEQMPAHVRRLAIPDADHHVMIDQPLAFVAGLRGLLAGWG